MKYVILFFLMATALSCSKTSLSTEKNKSAKEASFLQSENIVLSSPNVEVDSILFKESASVTMDFGLADSEIKYSVYNNDKLKTYKEPLKISYSTTLKTHSQKTGFTNSETSEIKLVKVSDNLKLAKLKISPSPHENYSGQGIRSLTDLEKGSLNFRDGNKWLGFQSEEVTIDINLEEKKKINKVHVSLLSDHGAWIFMPVKISIFHDNLPYAIETYNMPAEAQPSSLEIIPISIANKEYDNLKIVITSAFEIPEWHGGKGTAPWLFIDEIIIE